MTGVGVTTDRLVKACHTNCDLQLDSVVLYVCLSMTGRLISKCLRRGKIEKHWPLDASCHLTNHLGVLGGLADWIRCC